MYKSARARRTALSNKRLVVAVKKKGLNKRQKNQVVSLVRGQQEMKYAWQTINSAAVTNTASLSQITQIAQGDTDTTRDGDRYKLVKLRFRAIMYHNAIANVQCRVIIFRWKPNSAPSAADLLLTGGTGSIDITSEYQHDTRQQFQILYDKMFTIGSVQPPQASKVLMFQHVFKGKSGDCQMNAASATAGTNQLWLLTISDNVTGSTLKGTLKLNFTDS